MASDEAARAYMEKTSKEDQTANGIWDAMTKASQNMVQAIAKKDFTKYLAIANPKNGDDFLAEVRVYLISMQILLSHSLIFLFIYVILTCYSLRSIDITVNSLNQRCHWKSYRR